MARYYDMDKLKEMIEAKADTLIEGKQAFLYVAKWIDLLPPADVVPKSELNKIFRLIEECVITKVVQDGKVVYDKSEQFLNLKKLFTEGKYDC